MDLQVRLQPHIGSIASTVVQHWIKNVHVHDKHSWCDRTNAASTKNGLIDVHEYTNRSAQCSPALTATCKSTTAAPLITFLHLYRSVKDKQARCSLFVTHWGGSTIFSSLLSLQSLLASHTQCFCCSSHDWHFLTRLLNDPWTWLQWPQVTSWWQHTIGDRYCMCSVDFYSVVCKKPCRKSWAQTAE